MTYIKIDESKRNTMKELNDIKTEKEKALFDKVTIGVVDGIEAGVRLSTTFSSPLLTVSFTEQDVFWGGGLSRGVVSVDYNLNKDSFEFSNSSGGTNNVSTEQIVDTYIDIYKSAKTVIKNIKDNKAEYRKEIEDIADLDKQVDEFNMEIRKELKDNIKSYINETLNAVGVHNNTEEDVKKLMEKAETSGLIDIYSYQDYDVREALEKNAVNKEADVKNAEMVFKKGSFSCEVSDNNKKRYYLNNKFYKKAIIVELLKEYVNDDNELIEQMKKGRHIKGKIKFGFIQEWSENKQKVQDTKDFLDELEGRGKTKRTPIKSKP
jgi:hypothetical protein